MSQWSFGNLQQQYFYMHGYFIKYFFIKVSSRLRGFLKSFETFPFFLFQNLPLDFPSNLAHGITCRTKPFEN